MVRGSKTSSEAKRKISLALRGRHLSEETKLKISEANKGKSSWIKGQKHSEETRKKISKGKKGKPNGRLGKRHSAETLKKMSDMNMGKKNPQWKGGITPVVKLIRYSTKYLKWRSDIFLKDNFTCQKCGVKNGDGRTVFLEAHRKKPFRKLLQEVKNYLPLLSLYEGALIYTPLWDINNGITLCLDCHRKIRKHKIETDKACRNCVTEKFMLVRNTK